MSAWTEAALCVDADLTAYESRMPEAAKKVRGDSNASAYDGKRLLAKEEIEVRLEGRGIDVDGILRPAQFRRAAVFCELAMIYRDLAQRNDNVAGEKALYYEQRFDNEMERIAVEYVDPGDTKPPVVRPQIWMRRS